MCVLHAIDRRVQVSVWENDRRIGESRISEARDAREMFPRRQARRRPVSCVVGWIATRRRISYDVR